MASSKQELVGAGGVALLAVSFWTSPNRAKISTGLFSSSSTDADRASAHQLLLKYAGALAFIAVSVLVAGISDSAGTAMLAVIAALFLVWAMTHFGGGQTQGTATNSSTRRTA